MIPPNDIHELFRFLEQFTVYQRNVNPATKAL